MRILGVDYGLARIGIAIGETEVNMAFARDIISATGDCMRDATMLTALFKKEECEKIVLGLPLLPSGEEGESVRMVRVVGEAIAREGIEVEYFDERYTSAAAEAALMHLSPRKRKTVADSEAARIMLTEYLQRADQK